MLYLIAQILTIRLQDLQKCQRSFKRSCNPLKNYINRYDILNDRWVTVFGDHEIYTPEDGYFDNEFDNEEEAYEFFNDYEGIYDDGEQEF